MKRHLLLVSTIAGGLLTGFPALAQAPVSVQAPARGDELLQQPVSEAPASEANARVGGAEDQDIVVTALKRETRLQEVPVSVSVFSGENLEDQGLDRFDNLEEQIPNFLFFSDRATRAAFNLRGIGLTTTENLAPGVGLYVDGVYQPSTAYFNLPFFDLERIEVLKGPQGTLYGRNSFAGAINIITRAPDNDFTLRAQTELAEGETFKSSAAVSGPLIRDRLFVRVAAAYQDQKGFFRYAASGNRADPEEYVLLRGRLRFVATDRLTFDVNSQYFDLDAGSFALHSVDGINAKNENIILNEPQYEKAKFWNASLRAAWEGEAFDVISLTSYDDQKNDSLIDVDFTAGNLIKALGVTDRTVFAQELRAQSRGNGPIDWVVGAYYSKQKTEASTNRSGGFFPRGPVLRRGTSDVETKSAFTDLVWSITERLEVGGGLRYDHVKVQSTASTTAPVATGGVVTTTPSVPDQTFKVLQPRLTARYEFSDDLSAYANAARGFREGGVNTNALGTQFESFDKDTLWSYEIGLKSSFGRSVFNAAAFYIDADRVNSVGIAVIPGIGAAIVTVPIGAQKSYGFEVDGTLQVGERLSLNAGGGYNETELNNVAPTALPGTREGQRALWAPLWSFKLGGDYEVPVGGNGAKLILSAGVTGTGPTEQPGDAVTGPVRRDPYYLVNAQVAFEMGWFRAALFARNLTDVRIIEQFNSRRLLAPFGATRDVVLYNEPRYYGVRFELNF